MAYKSREEAETAAAKVRLLEGLKYLGAKRG